jgi:hypothetical protein
MKKLVLLVFVLFALINVSGLTLEINDVYSPKETIISKISGNFLNPISKDQINLVKDGHIDVAFEFDFGTLNGDYYIWIIAPANPGNYTLIIEDVYAMINGAAEIVDFEENFVVKGNITDYSIKPGFIFTTSDFEIDATVYSDEDQVIEVDFPDSREITLRPGANKIDFSISDVIGTEFITISVGKYNVPAQIVGNTPEEPRNDSNGDNVLSNQTNGTNGSIPINESNNYSRVNFGFRPNVIRSVALVGEDILIYPFEIINLGERIENIYFSYDSSKFEIFPSENFSLAENSSASFNLVLRNISGNETGGAITAYAGNETRHLVLILNFTTNETQVATDYDARDNIVPTYRCSELGGIFCVGDETCTGEVVASSDGTNCCSTGQCEGQSTEGNRAWIGYLIVGIVILALLIIYAKYKKTKASKNPLKTKVSQVEKNLP